MALVQQSHLRPPISSSSSTPSSSQIKQIVVEPYVITLSTSEELMMDCECGRCCLSFILQLPGGEAPTGISCPSTAGVDGPVYAETLTEYLFQPLHSLGLVQTRHDDFFLLLFRFAFRFSTARHRPHSIGPQIVRVAFISVSTIEEVLLARSVQDTGPVLAKRATRDSIRALPAAEAEELEAGDSCAICIEEFQDEDQEGRDRIARLPCRHVFHRHCIAGWLDNSHVCPLCRFEMPAELF